MTLELPGAACCVCLVDCRQGDALLGMQDDSQGKDIAYALDNGEVQARPPTPPACSSCGEGSRHARHDAARYSA